MKIFLLPLMLLISSCSTPIYYSNKVDSISSTSEKASFIIVPGLKDVRETDLRFKEFAEVAARGLEKAGYRRASSPKNTKLVVELSYSVSDPSTRTEYNYVQKTTKVSNGFGQELGSVSGYVNEADDVTEYRRKVVIKAFNLNKTQAWETSVISTGSSGDLRKVFPFLITAAIPYFGVNTGTQLHVEVPVTSETALQLRQPASH